MGLAGEDELHWPLWVVEDLRQPFGITEEQRGPLIPCEPPGEADREDAGVQGLSGASGRTGKAAAHERFGVLFAGAGYQLFTLTFVDAPEFLVRDFRDSGPAGAGGIVAPIGADVAVKEVADFVADPGGQMDAVRDGVDGCLLERDGRPG